MSWFSNAFILSIILLLAGAGIPLMAGLNAGLGTRLGNPVPAAFMLFLLALAITTVLALTNPMPSKADILATPGHYYLGGTFVAIYVLSITWIAPKLGLGNAIFLVLFGQMVAATVIDHHGLFDLPKAPVSVVRMVGIGLIAVGIYLTKKPVVGL